MVVVVVVLGCQLCAQEEVLPLQVWVGSPRLGKWRRLVDNSSNSSRGSGKTVTAWASFLPARCRLNQDRTPPSRLRTVSLPQEVTRGSRTLPSRPRPAPTKPLSAIHTPRSQSPTNSHLLELRQDFSVLDPSP